MSKSKDTDADVKPKKGGKLKLIIGAYGAMATGMIGDSGEEGPDVPQLVEKGDADPYAPAEEEEIAVPHGDGGSEYRTAYFMFEEGFTSNLQDSPGLVQVTIAASTRHDGRVIQWLNAHELAIRSAILVELANTVEDDVYTVEGKERLQERLAAAINAVLEEREGFGGVDAVYFQSFLVQ